ncbi:MAG: VWA domain-containing protein [Anaerolineales bacterium]|nr:VWA domain-containing protein [Anaerolineales bacterium]
MKRKMLFSWFLVLGLSLAGLAGCASQKDFTIQVAANTSLMPWLTDAAEEFARAGVKTSGGRSFGVTLAPAEAGQEVADILAGASNPALWIPDSPVWADVLADKGNAAFTTDCAGTAQSPLIIALWRPIAESLGWPGRPLGWLDIGSLAADPSAWSYYSGGQFGSSLRLGHTHPGLSGSGASTLLAVVQSARSMQSAVTVEDIQKPVVQASVGAFESAVSSFGTSTDELGRTMRDRGVRYLGAAVLYENTVVEYGQGDPGIVSVYPSEGTFVATHPACVNAAANPETREAARLFRDFLTGEKAQKLAVAHGLRPVNPAVPAAAPLDAAHGVDLAQPQVVFDPPSVASLYAAQSLWQVSRKPVSLVMILDTSGSMQGEKLKSARAAAVEFVEHMGETDYLSLITFNTNSGTGILLKLEHLSLKTDRRNITDTIASLTADGGTPLYDAIAAASDVILRHRSSGAVNIIIVLSDGLDTASSRYKFDDGLFTLAAAHDTMVYTIAYGSDADKNQLSKLALETNGRYYEGTTANIAEIYSDMSASFGGSAGIGR